MNKATTLTLPLALSFAILLPACSESGPGSQGGHAHGPDSHEHASETKQASESGDTHVHSDGSTHAAHEESITPTGGRHTHADGSTHSDHAGDQADMHQEIALDSITINGMNISLTQNHGTVGAGEEEHLIVKIEGSESNVIAVRAWIGTEDRTLSYVGKGDYTIINDAYDIHTMAPDPLPANTMWWIEIEMGDGTRAVGSTKPAL